MTLDDLLKPNLVTLLALSAVSVALPKVLPDMRPGLRSAIKVAITLFTIPGGFPVARQQLVQPGCGMVCDTASTPTSQACGLMSLSLALAITAALLLGQMRNASSAYENCGLYGVAGPWVRGCASGLVKSGDLLAR